MVSSSQKLFKELDIRTSQLQESLLVEVLSLVAVLSKQFDRSLTSFG